LSPCRFLMAAAAACVFMEAAAQAIPMDESGFTEFVLQAMRREVGDTPVSTRGPLTLSVGPLQANLDRIFAFCRVNRSMCAREVDRYVKGAAQVLKEQIAPLDTASIRVVVRSTEYIKRAQASLGSDGPALQVKPLVDGLVSVAVLDTPRAVRPLDDRDLGKLNLSQDQLFQLASENVASNLKPLSETAKAVGSGQIGTIAGSVYEVGRIAVHSQWAPLAAAQNGTLLVALPTTDVVLYVSESTPAAIDALRALSRRTFESAPNPLSATAVLRWSKERWEPVP
jgi:uncharacterized protein YtpQ (UPF0354 family)